MDPEQEYAKLASGDAARLRSEAETHTGVVVSLDGVGVDLEEGASLPVWMGPAAIAFTLRTQRLIAGASANRVVLSRVRAAVSTAAALLEDAEERAYSWIAAWRDRPRDMAPVFERMWLHTVHDALVEIASGYSEKLTVLRGELSGERVDLESMSDETRDWVELGQSKTDDWLKDRNSTLGPLIPNTAATGDDRGWTPQGMGYDPAYDAFLQAYYTEDHDSALALIDRGTGEEVGEVMLGDSYEQDGERVTGSTPSHAGGVAVDGDDVYVTDNGRVYTYSLADLRAAGHGDTVDQSAPPQELDGGSYAAVHDGRLYLGNFKDNELYEYERNSSGEWEKVATHPTPKSAQGVAVRDGEFVYSTSHMRHRSSKLVVVDRETGARRDYEMLPNMSQGVVEVDGELVTSYESGAEKFDHLDDAFLWFGPEDDRLWANPYMTRTPLGDLGLGEDASVGSGEVSVEPATLKTASESFRSSARRMRKLSDEVAGSRVPAAALAQVDAAGAFAEAVNERLRVVSESLGLGVKGVDMAAELLVQSCADYAATDDAVSTMFTGGTP